MLIVDPTFTPPPPATVLTAPDGIVSAKVDAANAGVLLKADFSAAADLPERVRFVRGDGLVVRSGDPAWAPGGIAVAYDHEAVPGAGNSYYAVPIYPDDSEGDASQTVAVGVPLIPDASNLRKRTWVKAPTAPSLSLMFRIASIVQSDRYVGAQTARVIGSPLPMVSRDVLGGLTGSMVLRTDTREEYMATKLLLGDSTQSGANPPVVLLFQPPQDAGEESMYFMVTKVGGAARLGDHSIGWRDRLWQIEFQECRRPSTTDSPLRIPGLSYDSVDAQYASYEDRAAQVSSYLALLGW